MGRAAGILTVVGSGAIVDISTIVDIGADITPAAHRGREAGDRPNRRLPRQQDEQAG